MARCGIVLHCEVQSCLAKRGFARYYTKLSCGLERPGCAGRATVERGFVWQGKVRFFEVWSGLAMSCFVLWGVGGVLYSEARSCCGVAWNREALHGIVKFGPVKHCVARCAKALLRSGIAMYGTVRFGLALLCAAGQALVRFYFGLARQGGALLSTARQGKVFVRPCEVGVMRGYVW